jgi:hypothetical protein
VARELRCTQGRGWGWRDINGRIELVMTLMNDVNIEAGTPKRDGYVL